MRSFPLAVAVATAILFAAAPAMKSDGAGWQQSAARAPAGLYSPIHPAECNGQAEDHCPAGSYWVCGPYGQRCWCTPC